MEVLKLYYYYLYGTSILPILKKNYVVLPLCIANDCKVFRQQPLDKVSRNTVTGSRVDHIMHFLI